MTTTPDPQREGTPLADSKARTRILFCCLNPSTADADSDDPTLRRIVGFATREGADCSGGRSAIVSAEYRYLLRRGDMQVVNLYAYRSPSPDALATRPYADRIGPDCDHAIVNAATWANLIIVGWGSRLPRDGGTNRARRVLATLRSFGPVYCLGRNADGQPRHPLYLKATTPLGPL